MLRTSPGILSRPCLGTMYRFFVLAEQVSKAPTMSSSIPGMSGLTCCGEILQARRLRCGLMLCAVGEIALPASTSGPGFAKILNDKYWRRLVGQTLMVNEWYLAVLYRPTSG